MSRTGLWVLALFAGLLILPLTLASGFAKAKAPAEITDAACEPWVIPERRANRANPVETSPAVLAQGRELYNRSCAVCHGESGANDGRASATVPNLNCSRKLSDPAIGAEKDGALFAKVIDGRGSMPKANEATPEADIWAVVHYMRSLQTSK
jgi:mono/diheme cytochrome c family protein